MLKKVAEQKRLVAKWVALDGNNVPKSTTLFIIHRASKTFTQSTGAGE